VLSALRLHQGPMQRTGSSRARERTHATVKQGPARSSIDEATANAREPRESDSDALSLIGRGQGPLLKPRTTSAENFCRQLAAQVLIRPSALPAHSPPGRRRDTSLGDAWSQSVARVGSYRSPTRAMRYTAGKKRPARVEVGVAFGFAPPARHRDPARAGSRRPESSKDVSGGGRRGSRLRRVHRSPRFALTLCRGGVADDFAAKTQTT